MQLAEHDVNLLELSGKSENLQKLGKEIPGTLIFLPKQNTGHKLRQSPNKAKPTDKGSVGLPLTTTNDGR
ncbi:hypothetical protein CEXT_521741 [Caerostris extrusa]|uniref:Uncharacterized protein n=1 Tax=Caerostris extrusa TaxID=172846 RepID=A0AAV4SPZ9_CAEEX|nr:hypothetical protein CEXT_521741 [Caerostris extrusa]